MVFSIKYTDLGFVWSLKIFYNNCFIFEIWRYSCSFTFFKQLWTWLTFLKVLLLKWLQNCELLFQKVILQNSCDSLEQFETAVRKFIPEGLDGIENFKYEPVKRKGDGREFIIFVTP